MPRSWSFSDVEFKVMLQKQKKDVESRRDRKKMVITAEAMKWNPASLLEA